jgi:hypothetical protein
VKGDRERMMGWGGNCEIGTRAAQVGVHCTDMGHPYGLSPPPTTVVPRLIPDWWIAGWHVEIPTGPVRMYGQVWSSMQHTEASITRYLAVTRCTPTDSCGNAHAVLPGKIRADREDLEAASSADTGYWHALELINSQRHGTRGSSACLPQ